MRFVMLLAFALVIGVPAHSIAMPATDDCNWSSLAVHQDGDCGNASSVCGRGLLCMSGPAACAEPSAPVADTVSLAPCSENALLPTAYARAPDTAPPKRITA